MFDTRTLENHEVIALLRFTELKTVGVPELGLEAKGLIEFVDGEYRLTDTGRTHVHKITHLYIQYPGEM